VARGKLARNFAFRERERMDEEKQAKQEQEALRLQAEKDAEDAEARKREKEKQEQEEDEAKRKAEEPDIFAGLNPFSWDVGGASASATESLTSAVGNISGNLSKLFG
jgi:septal ring factor EnvC (AmiA/AmiB activator)